MAHYGGPSSPPRVHRPRAPIMSAQPPITAPLTPLRPPPPVTLAAPRPENERAANEYVETPFRTNPPTPPPPQPLRSLQPTRLRSQQPSSLQAITKQPSTATSSTTTASFSKDTTSNHPSILCPKCNGCLCKCCEAPRTLPQRWVCNDRLLLSADSIIDYTSCLCCVKALFYHCSDSDSGAEGQSCADDPCSCGPNRRTARWGLLGALSFVLPCLWLYWPLQGCKRTVEVCYLRHSRVACSCRQPVATPEKRLLDSSPDF